jgi:2-polyprenyl-3-methyl-5-hydroxy-6-metoxy-1,4-benzoquinol methylase
MSPESPITGSRNTDLIKITPTKKIEKMWLKKFNINISKEFKNVDKIKKYRCRDTKLQFFRPKSLSGSEELYKKLQKYDWYYMKDKWEYEMSKKIIDKDKRVLVVGCGKGHFVEELNKSGVKAKGIDLSSKAIKIGRKLGRNVEKIDIKDVPSKNNRYDYVCCFQVLEHVENPIGFINQCISKLKKGGYLIIGVPNMGGYMGNIKNDILNNPPHHITQWFPETFKKIPNYLPVKMKKIYFEPLAKYHRHNYSSAKIGGNSNIPRIIEKGGVFLLTQLLRIPQVRKQITGHTQLVVLRRE